MNYIIRLKEEYIFAFRYRMQQWQHYINIIHYYHNVDSVVLMHGGVGNERRWRSLVYISELIARYCKINVFKGAMHRSTDFFKRDALKK